ncbi:MAG: deoxyhypusine synthase [Candidatus Woesearchaeota archaeon]
MRKARDIILKESKSVTGKTIKGYDFNKDFDINDFLKAYETTGYQATNLSKAIEIIKNMRKNKATIFFGYTSNIVSSGLRDVICYLAKNKLVDVIVTTAGGIEEDIIKCLKPFVLGDFRAKGKDLREQGINRIGNIFVPNDRYIAFEKFIQSVFNRLLEKQKKENRICNPSEFVHELGKEINDEESIYYWCYKNKIPVFCPAITDGSIGDMLYFFKQNNKELKLDISEDHMKLINIAINAEKSGLIILGAGLVKHIICNSNLFRDGADYAVYLNTAEEYDGSDAGALPDEAVSWGKIKPDGEMVKVHGDASIIFPLIVQGAFK